MIREIVMADEQAMLQCAKKIATHLKPGMVITLQGELGAGKTTFCRGLLRGLGYEDLVKSPTYNIVEEYQLKNFILYHFDLYRLAGPDELEDIGFKDYFMPHAVILIEWPEHGAAELPAVDIALSISITNAGRHIRLRAQSPVGMQVLLHVHG